MTHAAVFYNYLAGYVGKGMAGPLLLGVRPLIEPGAPARLISVSYLMPLTLDWKRSTLFVRTSTHTCVREDDPDREGLLSIGRWNRHTHVHFWLAEVVSPAAGSSHVKAYLGSVPLWNRDDINRTRASLNRKRASCSGNQVPSILDALALPLDTSCRE